MAQVPGLGLDQSQLADVINQQYKGYSQKQRNQMMQSAAASPDNWTSITQQSNKQAAQPTEYLGAGRLDNVPTYSKDGERWQSMDDDAWSQLKASNPYGGVDTSLAADYTNDQGQNFYKQSTLDNSYAHMVSGTPAKLYTQFNDPTEIKKGGYYYSDPWGYAHELQKMGSNTYFAPEFGHTRSGTADLSYGIKDPTGISRYDNNGQLGYLFNSDTTDFSKALQGGRNNSAFAEKKSNGFGSIAGQIMKYAAPIDYYVHGGEDYFNAVDEKGLYSAVFSNFGPDGKGLDHALDTVDPMHDTGQDIITNAVGADSQEEAFNMIAPTLVNMFAPYGMGYLINAGNQANQGNTTGALTNLASYGMSYLPSAAEGAGGTSTGMYGSGTSLGSVAADKAAQSFINSTAMNTISNGGDLGNALKSAAFSTAAGAGGDYISKLSSGLGEIASKALGGAASGGLNSLFTNNSPVNGSLFGAMSGGLHGFLNSTDRSNNTYNEKKNTMNKQTAQQAAKLAKLFVKK